jgi:hypothetical protein
VISEGSVFYSPKWKASLFPILRVLNCRSSSWIWMLYTYINVFNSFRAFSVFMVLFTLLCCESNKWENKRQKYVSRSEATILPEVRSNLWNTSGNSLIYDISILC